MSQPLCLVLFLWSLLWSGGHGSLGDRSSIYQSCLKQCWSTNCSSTEAVSNFTSRQPWHLRALQWDCPSECQHQCMWSTVNVVLHKGYPLPQFHGKWPFLRVLGMQEPASVLFSLLNGASHFWMWKRFKQHIPCSAPNYMLWKTQVLLSLNAWMWSAVFHIRDTPFTEKLDYFCAFSLVLYAFYSLVVRILGTNKFLLSSSIAVPFLAYYLYHIYFLTFVHFDYGYNMRANVTVGILNSLGWLLWCYLNRSKRHVGKCALSVLSVNCLLLLEVWDFPPFCYLLDSHSLWHLGTIPVPLLWYRFLIEDTRQLMVKASPSNGHFRNEKDM